MVALQNPAPLSGSHAQQVVSTHPQAQVAGSKTWPLVHAGRHAPVAGHRFGVARGQAQ